MIFPVMTLLCPLWALNSAQFRLKSYQKVTLGKKRKGRFKATQLATLTSIRAHFCKFPTFIQKYKILRFQLVFQH